MRRDAPALVELARSIAGHPTHDEGDSDPDSAGRSVASVASIAAPAGGETARQDPSASSVAPPPTGSVGSDVLTASGTDRDRSDRGDRRGTTSAPPTVAPESGTTVEAAREGDGRAEPECPGTGSDQTSTWRCYIDLGSGHRQAVRPDGTVYCGTCHPSSIPEPARPEPQDEDGFMGEVQRLLDAGALADHPPVRLGPGVVVADVERAVRADLLSARQPGLLGDPARDRLAALHRLVLVD